MKKIIILMLAVVIMLIALCACSNSNETTNSSTEEETIKKETEVTYQYLIKDVQYYNIESSEIKEIVKIRTGLSNKSLENYTISVRISPETKDIYVSATLTMQFFKDKLKTAFDNEDYSEMDRILDKIFEEEARVNS